MLRGDSERDWVLDRPIQKRLEWARRTCGLHGERLQRDPGIRDLLQGLKDSLAAAERAMRASGVPVLCARCEELAGGSCCGAGIERHYDGILLLVNALLGAALPGTRGIPGSCLFLGERGCVLKARHVLCVNYLCAEAEARVPPDRLAALREAEGAALAILFHLHERIVRALSNSSRGDPDRHESRSETSP